ncbi:hypothetical protein DM791_00940 [Paenarthrobacter nitroguajacolicus]|nr:hypothetical protein [Paenarthrobacter nitroguajacolicus]
MGISPATLLFGAACSSAASRFFDLKHRGGMILSQITKGENMKLVIGALGTAVVLAGAVTVSVQANATTPQDPGSQLKAAMAEAHIAGYLGWWNSTPLFGSRMGPPDVVGVNTNTGTIVEYFNRAKAEAGQQTFPSDATYNVVPDSTWPTSSVVIIDTATDEVIDSFPVDEKGRVIYTLEDGTKFAG